MKIKLKTIILNFFHRPKRGSKYQNSVMTSQNVHLKSHTEEYTNKTQMVSTLNSEVPKHSVWEERCVCSVVVVEVTHYTSYPFQCSSLFPNSIWFLVLTCKHVFIYTLCEPGIWARGT